METKRVQRTAQAGFTLVELIIVMVIVGILAAVAIPRLTGTAVEARTSVQNATLGGLKSAWSIAFARSRVAPTHTQVAAEMADPICNATANGITCAGVTFTDGTGLAVFGVAGDGNAAPGAVIEAPGNIVIRQAVPGN